MLGFGPLLYLMMLNQAGHCPQYNEMNVRNMLLSLTGAHLNSGPGERQPKHYPRTLSLSELIQMQIYHEYITIWDLSSGAPLTNMVNFNPSMDK